MKSAGIRKKFLAYFQTKQHELVASSSLIPGNDPTLLFTNAGMVQFKDVFLGLEKRSYQRAASSQRCVRAGGKHNDLENVGYTARHHTFFEMLGNFSFGDYFKREAIAYAWEFLTVILKLPQEKLWITVFEEDDEAADIWLKEMGVDPNRFSRCGEKDNFWAMGETGPCGPCTEIFYDHGPDVAGGPPGSPEADGDRYIEIWNLVFMQFNRTPDGKIKPLPKPSVDTGMGLERISAVMQGVHNNYDIDLFQHIIKAIAALAHIKDLTHTSLRVIADHIRSAAFLITDGVTPSNEGRGYVLRRIIRRALRHGHQLGLKERFFYKLIKPLVAEMGEAYPELSQAQTTIEKVLLREEETFAVTLEQGLKVFEQEIKSLKTTLIPGDIVFKLYDTYGFPMDLTADIARERNMTIDELGFHKEMEQQRLRSQAASKFATGYKEALAIEGETIFTGYEQLHQHSRIKNIIHEGKPVEILRTGEEGIIVLEQTPFYAESGGQIGDKGVLTYQQNQFEVVDAQKQGESILHYGRVKTGEFKLHDYVDAGVDNQRRQATAYNHTATHLLHAALQKSLGDHIRQKGSLVEPERLRFDFSHFEALTPAQIQTLEQLVNEKIRANLKVETKIMTPEEAMDSGAMALFGEKYGAEVRVLCIDDFSMELCGGTHVRYTGDIGFFKIISEAGIAAGIRRIEAITGAYAVKWSQQLAADRDQIATLLNTNAELIKDKIQQTLHQYKHLEKEIERLKAKLATSVGGDLSAQAKDISGIKVLAVHLEEADPKTLRDTLDRLKSKLHSAIILLATVQDEKATLVAGVTANLIDRFKAGDLINFVSEQLGGKGGGRADMAQGGGTEIDKLPQALSSVYSWVEEKI